MGSGIQEMPNSPCLNKGLVERSDLGCCKGTCSGKANKGRKTGKLMRKGI